MNIRNSTVAIGLVHKFSEQGAACQSYSDVLNDMKNRSNNCRRRDISLGAIVPEGIFTHDHFYDPLHPDQRLSGRIKTSGDYVYLYIEGIGNGHQELINISDPNFAISFPVSGVTLFTLPMASTTFGLAANKGPANLSLDDPVYFAHVSGDVVSWGRPWQDPSKVVVGVSFYMKNDPITSYRYLLHSVQTQPGDSGTGHFDSAGNLIGIELGAEGVGLIPGYNLFNPQYQAAAKVIQ